MSKNAPAKLQDVTQSANAETSKTTFTPHQNEDGEDAGTEDGVLFYINKGGFPILDFYWNRMWNHVTRLHPDHNKDIDRVRDNHGVQDVPVATPPSVPLNTPIPERVELIQKYMSNLQYNHTGTQFFEIRKNRPLSGLMDCAREIIRESLPIKCLEAVILGVHLTNGLPGLDRFPISFRSQFQGHQHRHVILGLHYGGRYGAIGMSRRPDLMFKSLKYRNLSEMLVEYIRSYNKYWHTVKKLKLGLPVTHDTHSYEAICWKTVSWSIPKMTLEDLQREIEKHAKLIRAHCRPILPEQLTRKSTNFALDQMSKHKRKDSTSIKDTKQSVRKVSTHTTPTSVKTDHPVTSPRSTSNDTTLTTNQQRDLADIQQRPKSDSYQIRI